MPINNYQLPLRMPNALASELHRVSAATGIGKSKLCRMGISRLIQDIKATGRDQSMAQLGALYRELT